MSRPAWYSIRFAHRPEGSLSKPSSGGSLGKTSVTASGMGPCASTSTGTMPQSRSTTGPMSWEGASAWKVPFAKVSHPQAMPW